MADANQWLALILPKVPSAPQPRIESALAMAAHEFCKRTRVWQEWCDISFTSDGTAVVALPDGAAATAGLREATINGYPLDVRAFPDMPTDGATGVPELVALWPDRGGLIFYPAPASEQTGVRALLALAPSIDSLDLPNFLFAEHAQALTYGALASMFDDDGMKWANPTKADRNAILFEEAIVTARVANFYAGGRQRAVRSPGF
jgi:hypothetical protein